MRGIRLTISLRKQPDDDGTYISFVRELPGCISWGFSPQEAFENVKQAADLYLQHLIEENRRKAGDYGDEPAGADVESTEYQLVG